MIRLGRGLEVPCGVLGADYDGKMGHDGWAPFEKFKKAIHGQCSAHFLSRCARLLETASRGAVRFPRAVKELLQDGLALRNRREAIFNYLTYPELEATNLMAEQAIRGAGVNRKVWGGSRTDPGADAQEILLILRTCAQRGIDEVEFLSRCHRSPPDQPVLLPELYHAVRIPA